METFNCHFKIISIGRKHSKDCFELDELALNGLWTQSQWETELSNSHKLCFGIFVNSKLVAFATGWLVIDELQINAVAVHPERRRSGLGTKVLSKLLESAGIKGALKTTLEVKTTNIPAKELYRKIGFEIIGQRENYYKDGGNATIFSMTLPPGEPNRESLDK